MIPLSLAPPPHTHPRCRLCPWRRHHLRGGLASPRRSRSPLATRGWGAQRCCILQNVCCPCKASECSPRVLHGPAGTLRTPARIWRGGSSLARPGLQFRPLVRPTLRPTPGSCTRRARPRQRAHGIPHSHPCAHHPSELAFRDRQLVAAPTFVHTHHSLHHRSTGVCAATQLRCTAHGTLIGRRASPRHRLVRVCVAAA